MKLNGKRILDTLNETLFGNWDGLPDTAKNRTKAIDLFIALVEELGYGCCDECEERMPDEPLRDEGRD